MPDRSVRPSLDRGLLLVLALVATARALELATHPFCIEGDGRMYAHMASAFESSLLHAGGYSFLVSPVVALARAFGVDVGPTLRLLHVAIEVAALGFLFTSLRRVVGGRAAMVGVVVIAFDALVLGAGSTSRPEFMQSMLTLVCLAAASRGLVARSVRRKLVWSGITGACVAAAYLSKYNSVVLVLLVAAPLTDPQLRGHRRQALGLFAAAGVAYAALFVGAFHAPSVRTATLNLEHGWIHMEKLRVAGIPVRAEHGLASRRYLIAIQSLPWIAPGAGPWRAINVLSRRRRAANRDGLSPFLLSDDAALLDAELTRLATLPASSPALDPRAPAAFCRLYHYLGLRESERLVERVFLEALRAHPGAFAAHVARDFLDGALRPHLDYVPSVPYPRIANGAEVGQGETPNSLGATLVYSEDDEGRLDAATWRPGARIISAVSVFSRVPGWALWLLALAGAPRVLASRRSGRTLTPRERLYILSLGIWLGLIAFSALVYEFRYKELVVVVPVAAVTIMLSLRLALTRSSSTQPA